MCPNLSNGNAFRTFPCFFISVRTEIPTVTKHDAQLVVTLLKDVLYVYKGVLGLSLQILEARRVFEQLFACRAGFIGVQKKRGKALHHQELSMKM